MADPASKEMVDGSGTAAMVTLGEDRRLRAPSSLSGRIGWIVSLRSYSRRAGTFVAERLPAVIPVASNAMASCFFIIFPWFPCPPFFKFDLKSQSNSTFRVVVGANIGKSPRLEVALAAASEPA